MTRVAAPAFPVLLRIPRLHVSVPEVEAPVAPVPKPVITPAAKPSQRPPVRRPTLFLFICLLSALAPMYWYLCTTPTARRPDNNSVQLDVTLPDSEGARPAVPAQPDGHVALDLLPDPPTNNASDLKAALLPDIVPLDDEGEP